MILYKNIIGNGGIPVNSAELSNQQTTQNNDFAEWLGIGSGRIQREFNSAEAQKQRDWEEYMSNTAYQRAVEDMKKAGINPVMAFQQGGANTPSGSSANSSTSPGTGANLIGTILTSAIKLLMSKK